ncbi:MAG: 2-alkenal reductase [Myxococcales bacterium]|nr:2-alkenal reductase [Myxococcales bacterium]
MRDITTKGPWVALVAALCASLAWGGVATAQDIQPMGPNARLEYEQNTIDVFRTVAPATVFVIQKRLVRDSWTRRAREYTAGSGSGFIWDRKGHVVTNYHVIADGNAFEVTLQDGKTYEAHLVGGDPNKDIAVLKLDKPPRALTSIQLPRPEYTLEVGQKALAIGNPFGLDHTLTVGVVSALGREMLGYGGTTIRGMIQTDASINPGNSGGPLLNARGQLIGMNTMIYSKTGSSVGIGFAVPVQTVRRVVPEIIRYGKPVRAGLGIQLVPDNIARRNGISGVVIEAVNPGSPAAQAGLRGLQRKRRRTLVGDVIVGINEHEVATYDDLFGALDRYRPGDSVKVKVQRDNRVITVPLKLSRLN